jgi:autotransporter-associated beta strand protein
MIKTGQALILGSTTSTHKLNFQDGLGLNGAMRTILVNDGISSTNVDGEVSGVITGNATAGIEKTGAGTLILSNSNTYDGSTIVSAGTLLINGNQTAANGSVTVAAGATLGGSGTLGGATTITGILAPGNSIGILNVAANTTWQGALAAGSTTDWKFELGGSNAADLLNITGNFLKDSSLGTKFRFDFLGSAATGTFKLVDWSGTTGFIAENFTYTNLGGGNTGSFAFNDSQLEFTVVPEPGTWALAVLGLFFLAAFSRKGKRASA